MQSDLFDQETNSSRRRDVGSLPSSALSSRIKGLDEAIHELNVEIRFREQLSQQFLNGIREETLRVRDLLSRLGEPWSRGYLPEFEELRTKLVAELFNLTNRERSEQLRMWEDLVALKRQRRTFLMEYQTLRRTSELLVESEEGGQV